MATTQEGWISTSLIPQGRSHIHIFMCACAFVCVNADVFICMLFIYVCIYTSADHMAQHVVCVFAPHGGICTYGEVCVREIFFRNHVG